MNKNIPDEMRIEIWREAMAHLRHLSDDVWNGLKLFLVLNGFIFVSIFGILAVHSLGKLTAAFVFILCVAGISLTLAARYILKRHRIYYLQMLAKKSLLETELGFYETNLSGSQTDLAFPWRLTPEVVAEIKANSEAWIQKSIRAKGTIAQFQFLIYEMLIGLYCCVLVAILIDLLR